NGRPSAALEEECAADGTPLVASDGTTPPRPTEESQVIGLALSGGGIRSAAFSLGVLQALDSAEVLKKVDYLSTVSGGGYIGCSLSSGMTATEGHFPFASYLSEDETPSLQHIRDYSNYLFPQGAADVLRNASVYARGLVANAILILPFLLIGAALTIFSKPYAGAVIGPNFVGFHIPDAFNLHHFVVSTYLALLLLAALIVWGIGRSLALFETSTEVPSWAMRWVGRLVLLLLFVLFCEIQPFILDAMFAQGESGFLPSLVSWIKSIVLVLSPVAAAIAFVARKFGEVIKSSLESERLRDQIPGYVAKLSVYVAAAIVPLLLWLVYLELSFWGICNGECVNLAAPGWLVAAADHFPGAWTPDWPAGIPQPIAWLYVAIAVACVIIALFLRPNANSLHPLYRDRLAKAFIFKPEKIVPRDETGVQPALESLHRKLSGLSDADSPYHLINTALNVQDSKAVNRRGRNADFFLFSRNYVGSRATRYVATTAMEAAMPTLDLATAMAASGAAASANMGSASIKPLTPTLALLNIRLGYWLRNPKQVDKGPGWNPAANFYFLLEMFGLLTERRRSVYVTDGGHIENLGIYELLRRRCQVIIAVDAEADGQMAFGSFNVLERYALIDLGVRIDLPWQKITDTSKATGKAIDEKGDADKQFGPHVAVGEIGYPGNRKGILIYIKSSLTGDENDYIFHYKKRYGAFPQETTADQLFSEEQFEAYRALGFHSAHRFFDRRDQFAHRDPKENPCIVDHLAYLDEMFPPSLH
ncbi:MAG TPA: patatin-like phospholipase family protein, partial [Bradyrhizobium sp.]|nr:patatin-like phospholipase family protein [Bradyrhizobium sp.]